MAGTINKVILIGHTGDDVKMHHFEGGGSIGRVPLATNEEYTNKNTGERVSNVEWHNCVLRNKQAEVAEKYLKKGDKVYFEGRLKTRKWKDQSGADRYSTEINVLQMTFLSAKGEGQQSSGGSTNSPSPSPQPNAGSGGDDHDDLPF